MSDTFTHFIGEFHLIAQLKAKSVSAADELVALLQAVKAACDSKTLIFDILRYGQEICVVEKYKNVATLKELAQTTPFHEFVAKRDGLILEGGLVVKCYESA